MNPYSTHLAVLEFLKRLPIRRVLELGSGEYSTPKFLTFPRLEYFLSLETEPEWIWDKNKTSRFVNKLVIGDIKDELESITLSSFDLIFIDAYSDVKKRADLIEYISSKHLCPTLVVLHDYENILYRNASRTFAHRLVYDREIPNTAILWN